jgi:hypothetical protein
LFCSYVFFTHTISRSERKMYPIAKKTPQKQGNVIGIAEWFKLNCVNFDTHGFMVKGINHEHTNGHNMDKVAFTELVNFRVVLTHHYEQYITKKTSIGECLVLPLKVPSTPAQMHFVASLLSYCYSGDFNGALPDPHIVCTMLFSLMQRVVFELSSITPDTTKKQESFYAEVLLWLFYTTRMYTHFEPIANTLVHTLAICVEPADVIERTIAYLVEGNDYTNEFVEQVFCLSMARKVKWFEKRKSEEEKEQQVSLTTRKEFTTLNILMTVLPLLSHFKEPTYRPEVILHKSSDVSYYVAKLHECYVKLAERFEETGVLKKQDENFDASADVCQAVYKNMVEVVGLLVDVPSHQWFTTKLQEISVKKFDYERQGTLPSFISLEFKPIRVPLKKNSDAVSHMATFYGNKIIPSTIVDWSSMEIKMKDNYLMRLTYSPLATAIEMTGDTRQVRDNVANVCILGETEREIPNQLCFNSGGSYSMITGQRCDGFAYEKTNPAKEVYIICKDAHVYVTDVTTDDVLFTASGNTFVLMMKNVEVNIPAYDVVIGSDWQPKSASSTTTTTTTTTTTATAKLASMFNS